MRDAGGGRTCICQAVVDPEGALVLAYDKMHLCDMGDCSEVGYGCSPGGEPGVFEVDGVRVGLTICYDIRFPVRALPGRLSGLSVCRSESVL